LSWISPVKFSIHFCWKVNTNMSDNQVMNNNHIAFPKSSRIIQLLQFPTTKLITCIPSRSIDNKNSVMYRFLVILKWCSIVHQFVMHWHLLSHTMKYEAVPYPKSRIFISEPSFINWTVDSVILKADETLQKLRHTHRTPSNQHLPVQKYKDNSNVPQVLWHTQLPIA